VNSALFFRGSFLERIQSVRRRLESSWRQLRDIFEDRITQAAGVVFLLILVMVIFNTVSSLPERVPLFGVFSYGAVLVLFILGGIIFVLALLRS
jgi:hypothetical protein